MMFRVHDRRSYNLEQIAVMVSAFKTTYGSLSMGTNVNHDDVRETLARIILWHFDLGERDPVRLSNLALRTLVDDLPPDEGATASDALCRQRHRYPFKKKKSGPIGCWRACRLPGRVRAESPRRLLPGFSQRSS
jgi:hypothetical protein